MGKGLLTFIRINKFRAIFGILMGFVYGIHSLSIGQEEPEKVIFVSAFVVLFGCLHLYLLNRFSKKQAPGYLFVFLLTLITDAFFNTPLADPEASIIMFLITATDAAFALYFLMKVKSAQESA